MKTLNTYYKDGLSLEAFVYNNRDILMSKQNRSVFVQIFSGIVDRGLLLGITEQVCSLLPQAQVIGATTHGEIMNGGITGLSIVLSFSVFQHAGVQTGFAEKNGSSDYELGRSIAARLNHDDAKVLIVFSSGLTVNASKMLRGIQSVNATLPVAGGNAGDNFNNKQCFVFGNEGITDKGVVGAVITGKNLIVTRYHHLGWQPIGKEMTITRAEGARVYTIDHIPAYQVYRHYLGSNDDFDIINGIEFPLSICGHGLDISRTPFLRYDDDSLAFFGDMDEGEKVRLSFGHINLITERIDTLLQTIRQQPVESIFVYSCAARRSFLQESAQIETLPLQEIAPTAGFFTSGEYFHADCCNQLLNNTMTTLGIAEPSSSVSGYGANAVPDARTYLEPIDSTNGVEKDNVINRSVSILRALTCLVNSVTSELNERSLELQMANEQLQFSSTHDALTGLYNRGFFQQKITHMKSESPGIVMCDVDGLKIINDTIGHNMGDQILQATADILRSLSTPEDVVARIGGDEFAVMLSHRSQPDVEEYCHRVRNEVAKYNLANPAVPLSVSIGYSCHGEDGSDISMLLKNADDKMYREKLHRRRSTHSDLVQTLLKALETRGIISEGKHKQDLLVAFALDRGIPRDRSADLRLLARFHDIGKVGISDQVLFKSGPLIPEEKREMQRHCEIGHRIASASTDLLPIAPWVLRHHEWWNGQGYPLGLKGVDIPVECRLLAIVNAYEAMIHDRPHRKAISCQDALAELRRCAGTQLDPVLVDGFIAMMKEDGCP